MISWGDVYKVGSAMVPLYVPLLLGFWSVRWWKMFTPEQCEAVNRLVAIFAVPFFTFGFTVHTDPLRANYRAIAADVVSKIVIVAGIGAWVCFTGRGHDAAVNWSITGFSLSTLTSSLVVGVPMAQAMYGEWAEDLVIQLSIFQAVVWLTLLLFALEVRKAAIGTQQIPSDPTAAGGQEAAGSLQINDDVEASAANAMGDGEASSMFVQLPHFNDAQESATVVGSARPPSIWALVKAVSYKLVRNPNTYASLGGIIVACIANRFQMSLPIIIENSNAIMARCGNGLAMFSMGLFMAQQDNLIPCGTGLIFLGLVLKFALGPVAMAIGSFAVGLRGTSSASPSYRVIVGMLVSVPLIILFYVGLDGF